jgi:hypothetical protein
MRDITQRRNIPRAHSSCHGSLISWKKAKVVFPVSPGMPQVTWSDVSVDSILGMGGFCSVFQVQVTIITNNQDVVESKTKDIT